MGSVCRLIFAAALLVVALLPRTARAEGVLYVAHEPDKTFPLTRTDVKLDAAADIVSATVTQRFTNPFKERIEAVYVFPLPAHSAVDDMEMRVGRRVIRAEVKRRAQAQAEYDRATRRGQRAALLEQERPNVFTFNVANIDPGGTIEVTLHYFELAKYDHGTYEVAFPMVVGPRYIPGQALPGPQSGTGTRKDTDKVPDASRISPAYAPPMERSGHTIGLAMRIDAGAPLETLETPAHDVTLSRLSPSLVDIALRDKAEIPNRDFVVRWRLAANELKTALFAHRGGDEGYVALLLEPKHDPVPAEIAPRELFFLLDTSGSMRGTPLQTAVSAVSRALDTLNPSDTFQIIDFADSASSFSPKPLPNTRENVARAKAYLAALHGSGGTNQLVGIHAALSAPGDERRVRFVMFMTDGYIGNEHAVVELVKREIGRSRIYGFGVGSSVNRYLLEEVSYIGRGSAEFMRPQEEPSEIVERFYARIGRPYLTDLAIDWGGLSVSDVVPAALPDLSAFAPLAVVARYAGGGKGTVTVRGKLGGKPFTQKLEVTLPERELSHEAIDRVWARERIAELSHGNSAVKNEQEITRLALAHHLVSQYTSLVAIDETPGESSGFPLLVRQPSEAPEGVDLASAGGQYATATPTPTAMEPPPPAPPASGSDNAYVMQERAPRGCGGCAVGVRTTRAETAAALLALLGIALVLRSRQKARRTET
jgi:Ca-activated chloride channel family protein